MKNVELGVRKEKKTIVEMKGNDNKGRAINET